MFIGKSLICNAYFIDHLVGRLFTQPRFFYNDITGHLMYLNINVKSISACANHLHCG